MPHSGAGGISFGQTKSQARGCAIFLGGRGFYVLFSSIPLCDISSCLAHVAEARLFKAMDGSNCGSISLQDFVKNYPTIMALERKAEVCCSLTPIFPL